MTETAEEYFARQAEPAKSICLKLRELILANIPEIKEGYKWNSPTYTLDGVNLLYIANMGKTVNLGFMFGAAIDDPYGLIEGTGQRLRHIKFANLEAIDPIKLAKLLGQAATVR